MFVHYRTKGFILKKIDRGEADQLLTVYTKDFGKVEILAKAVRKISSKLRAGAEIFYFSDIEFIQGKVYKTLTDAILIERFENLRKDLKRLRIAHKIAGVLDDLVSGQESDDIIWRLLNEAFNNLNKQQSGVERYKSEILYHYFLWNLLSILGYEPELYNCAICRKKIAPEKLFFNPKEGGVICNLCEKSVKSSKEIEPETIKLLRILFKRDWTLILRLKMEKSNLELLDKVTNEYYSYILKNYNL